MTRITVQFTVIPINAAGTQLPPVDKFATVATIADVLPMLDEYTWITDSVTVTELTGSDATPRMVSESEWMTD